MTVQSLTPATALPADWRDFLALTKPRVMSLVVFTGLCGLLAANQPVAPAIAFAAILSIALGAGAAASLNQWYEADIDALMKRTQNRPLPAGRMQPQSALHFGVGLSFFSVILLGLVANVFSAVLLALSILYYVMIYTVWLKRRTPQNIVIGGAAGAFPPVIGWAAATGDVSLLPILMFTLVFLWTPPHSWALALFVKTDYAKAGVPMMPVVAGEASTRRQVLIYTVPMILCAVLPFALKLTGAIYGYTAILFSLGFLYCAWAVAARTAGADDPMKPEKRLFAYSIIYLFVLFGALAFDRILAA